MVIWLLGLSGAGKSTVARVLYKHLKPGHANLVSIDGDGLRAIWGNDLSHTVDGRQANARRVSHLTSMLDGQGIHVIAAVNVMFPEWREWNRQNLTALFEVFLDPPMDVLRERDTKGLYSAIEKGEIDNVVGVDIPYPRPVDADLHLAGPEISRGPEEIAQQILKALPADLGFAP